MSDFKIGDKVLLECEVKGMNTSKNTYLLRYRNWLDNEYETEVVKDDVLHSADKIYNKGLNDAWDLAKKIALPEDKGGYTADELEDIFGKRTFTSLMNTLIAQEALAKVKAYEERNEIRVGDVVKVRCGGFESIVTKVDGRIIYRIFRDGSFNNVTKKEDLIKTGRHFDSIDAFINN